VIEADRHHYGGNYQPEQENIIRIEKIIVNTKDKNGK